MVAAMPSLRERLAGRFAAASSAAVTTRVTTDTQDRFVIDAGGRLTWGDGSTAGDVTLYRSAANTLTTDDRLESNNLTVKVNGYSLITTSSNTISFAGTEPSSTGAAASFVFEGGNISRLNVTQVATPRVYSSVSDLTLDYAGSIGHGMLVISRAGTTVMTFGDANNGLHVAIGGSPLSTARLAVYPRSTSEIPLVIRGLSGQTANLHEWQNSAGTVTTAITSAGQITTTGTIQVTDNTPRLSLVETGGSAGRADYGVSGLYPTLTTRDSAYTLRIDGRSVPVIDTGATTPTLGGRNGMQWITGGVIRQHNGTTFVPLAVPSGGTIGQVLAKSSNTDYDTSWTTATGGSIVVGDTPPTSPATGDLWYESDTGKIFIRYDSFWVEVSSAGPTGSPGIVVSGTAPTNTNVIWADITSPGSGVTTWLRRSDWVEPFNYLGTALPGYLETQNVWSITRLEVSDDGGVTVTHAEDVAWTDRTTATYA